MGKWLKVWVADGCFIGARYPIGVDMKIRDYVGPVITPYQLCIERLFVAGLTISYALVAIWLHIHPYLVNYGLSLLNLGFLGIVLLSIGVRDFIVNRKTSKKVSAAALLCTTVFLVVCVIQPLAMKIGNYYFLKHIAPYVKIIDDIKRNDNIVPGTFSGIKVKDLPPHIKSVSAIKCSDGALVVEFFIDLRIPLAHAAYVYKGYSDENTSIPYRARPEHHWLNQRKISDAWYRASD